METLLVRWFPRPVSAEQAPSSSNWVGDACRESQHHL